MQAAYRTGGAGRSGRCRGSSSRGGAGCSGARLAGRKLERAGGGIRHGCGGFRGWIRVGELAADEA